MTRVRRGSGFIVGTAIALAVCGVAATTLITGNMHIRLAGLDVSVQNQTERGLVVRIDGADCPGKGCPAFALDWRLPDQG